ncbi:sugar phosphate nucleotidyltransferase [Aquibacillus albus]|uniref:Mannose-1-phosphate guanylyltransferase n=1 Tax=Aquibacillus albus TaxID=1168171 RepID=A0ABS2N5S0_9BACI|nr:sugar phosphate nucleotidyltransferase [Aquibacillus albus]MBM7573502.1 mannose-1-phosphate guanylyltransferase [Aquibacillus albus]
MKLILLSGGSGKRLWPLSNDIRSKQFLKILEGDDGQKESMVQRVWRQIKSANLHDSTLISTSSIQKEMIHHQLGLEVPVIVEPERRDTFPAISLAASYLYSIESIDKDEVVVVLPVDPYVEDSFFERIKDLEETIKISNTDLALIGVTPTYPSSKYGYIVPKKYEKRYLHVSHFSEKPNEEKAKLLINNDALWNCGVFSFKLGYLLDILRAKKLPLQYELLSKQYSKLTKISFDYEVVEKANNVVALSYDGYWKDLGTWNTLTEEMDTNQIGKGVISNDCNGTHLINELDIPITVLGVNNLVVAASPDGILVSDKMSSPTVKDLIKGFDQPPRFEERIWGWSKTLDYSKYENSEEMVTKHIGIEHGKNSSYHFHNLRDEVLTIVKGEGELALDNSITRVKAGDVIHLPAGKKHGLKAISDLEFIEVQTGAGITDEDFIRIFFDWEDVIAQFKKSKATVIS